MTSIDASRWKSFADHFSKEHDGWSASLKRLEGDAGMEVVIDDRPFRGLTFEHRDSHESLILTFGDDADEHLTHTVQQPHDVSLREGDGACSLIIELADGSGCILELTNPLNPD
jgi:hypothetical protein